MLKKLYLKTLSYVLREDSCAISVSHTGFFVVPWVGLTRVRESSDVLLRY
jgi:hypothetical protein